MRNISFSLTTPQFRARTKTVTRRLGWLHLKAGDRLMGCEKCMGRKPGEPLVRLGEIEVVSVLREPLDAMIANAEDFDSYGLPHVSECEREGFPHMTTREFVAFFCKSHSGCTSDTIITRIEFKYISP